MRKSGLMSKSGLITSIEYTSRFAFCCLSFSFGFFFRRPFSRLTQQEGEGVSWQSSVSLDT